MGKDITLKFLQTAEGSAIALGVVVASYIVYKSYSAASAAGDWWDRVTAPPPPPPTWDEYKQSPVTGPIITVIEDLQHQAQVQSQLEAAAPDILDVFLHGTTSTSSLPDSQTVPPSRIPIPTPAAPNTGTPPISTIPNSLPPPTVTQSGYAPGIAVERPTSTLTAAITSSLSSTGVLGPRRPRPLADPSPNSFF